MSNLTTYLSFEELLQNIFDELIDTDSIFGFHRSQINYFDESKTSQVFTDNCHLPVGIKIEPPYQSAQYIIVAYLTGARFFDICLPENESAHIDHEQLYQEYIKAWTFIQIIEQVIGGGKPNHRSFIFNLSIESSADGTLPENTDRFIAQMRDAFKALYFRDCLEDLALFQPRCKKTEDKTLANKINRVAGLSHKVCRSVTVTNSHNHPSDAVEKLCHHLMVKRGMSVHLQLLPTKPDSQQDVDILKQHKKDLSQSNPSAWDQISPHDEIYSMISRLEALAQKEDRGFGINILNSINHILDMNTIKLDNPSSILPFSLLFCDRIVQKMGTSFPISLSNIASDTHLSELYKCGFHPIIVEVNLSETTELSHLSNCFKQIYKIDLPPNKLIDKTKLAQLISDLS